MKRLVLFVLLVGFMAFLGGALAVGSPHAPNEHSGTHAHVPTTTPAANPAPNAHSTTTGNPGVGNQVCYLRVAKQYFKNPGAVFRYIREHSADYGYAANQNPDQWIQNFKAKYPAENATVGLWIATHCGLTPPATQP